jgi:hypothetical protein
MRTDISASIIIILRDNIHFVEIHICIFSGFLAKRIIECSDCNIVLEK